MKICSKENKENIVGTKHEEDNTIFALDGHLKLSQYKVN